MGKKARPKVSTGSCSRYVSGILRMEEVRQHVALYDLTVVSLRSGVSPKPLMNIFGAEDANDAIQEVVISQISLLKPDVATDVVLFFNMLDGLRVDLKAMATGQMDALPVPEKIRIVESDRKLWIDTLGRWAGPAPASW